jgi:hypothetical protein
MFLTQVLANSQLRDAPIFAQLLLANSRKDAPVTAVICSYRLELGKLPDLLFKR